jgi:hypothetical protein
MIRRGEDDKVSGRKKRRRKINSMKRKEKE